jgi:RHS repeat-associated protein
MTSIGGSTPSYDANGNVLNDFLHSYTWDVYGRPITIDGVLVTYDALGRMVEQNRSGVYSEIVYAPTGTKIEIMSGQSYTKAFVPLPGGAVAVYGGGIGSYRHPDHLGSSRFASTTSRTMYYDGAYAPFGEPYAQTGSTDLSFTGMNQDTVSNLYDFPAREYGIQGRWPTPDPSGLASVTRSDPQTLNRYAYVRNNPLASIDPTGLHLVDCSWDYCGGGAGGGGVSVYVDGALQNVMTGLGANGLVACPNNVCNGFTSSGDYFQFVAGAGGASGYVKFSDITQGLYEANGTFMSGAQYQNYLQSTYPSQIASQHRRLSGNLDAIFGGDITADPNDPNIDGGHANFTLNCGDSPCPNDLVGRYDNGIHIECASGGYSCQPGSPLVVHDDTVSPWTGNFSFSSLFTVNFWRHGFVDLFGGQLCNCVFPQ